MNVSVTVLVENKTKRTPFGAIGRHGLSLLIEFDDGFKILYDTGPNWETLLHNALLLDKNLKDVDMIVISHGHHDHGNDLIPLLEYLGRENVPIVVHPLAFDRNSSIKVNSSKDSIKEMKADLNLIDKPSLIYKGVWFSGSIPRREGNPVHPVRNEKGEVVDEVLDDTSLYFLGKDGGIILTGCGHSGFINIVMHAKEILNVDNISAVVGGLHGIDQSEEGLESTVRFVGEEKIKLLAPCHCSGPLVFYLSRFPGFVDVGVGSSFVFEL